MLPPSSPLAPPVTGGLAPDQPERRGEHFQMQTASVYLAAIQAFVTADGRNSTMSNYDALKAAKQRLYNMAAGR